MLAIYRRELAAFRNNMVGGLCVAFLTACVGLYFFVYNLQYGYPSFGTALYVSLFIFLIAIPLLTMRSMAEERHSRTDQLLLTSPVTVTGVVLGKFFALVTVLAVPCVLFLACPLIMYFATGDGATVYFAQSYASLFCFFLLGAAYLSVGMLVSALTESQVIAAVGTFAILFILHMWSGIVGLLPTDAIGSLVLLVIFGIVLWLLLGNLAGSQALGAAVGLAVAGISVIVYFVDDSLLEGLVPNALDALSFTGVLEAFVSDQVFDVPGVVMLLSVTGLMLFLTVQVIQRRRWH